MNINDIYEMIQIVENSDLGNLVLSNEKVRDNLNLICNFLVNLVNDYADELDVLSSSNVRFCDYYDASLVHGSEIVDYFIDSYNGKDKERLTIVFAIYVFLRNVQEIVYNYEICDNVEELYDFLDCDNYFEDMLEVIYYLKEKKLVVEDENIPKFMKSDNKYKIMFSGLCLDDVKALEKTVKRAFIKKLGGQLSTSDCITLSESIDHVKEGYNFPISRIHLADDFRIAYIRRENVTVILGVSIKSGKEKDYNRYDSVAKRKSELYREIQLFNQGMLSSDSEHYKVLQILLDFYEKEMIDNNVKNNGRLK